MHFSFIPSHVENILVKIKNKQQQNHFHYNVLRTEQPWKQKSKCVIKNRSLGEEHKVLLRGHS